MHAERVLVNPSLLTMLNRVPFRIGVAAASESTKDNAESQTTAFPFVTTTLNTDTTPFTTMAWDDVSTITEESTLPSATTLGETTDTVSTTTESGTTTVRIQPRSSGAISLSVMHGF
jgi:hypothetical protein